jgi:hypothetical protein
MLLQLLTQHPEAAFAILKNTPTWVWGLLAGLLALGISQLFPRKASLARTVFVPVAMTVFAIWGMATAFGGTDHMAWVLIAWLAAAVALTAAVAPGAAAAGSYYDAASRTYTLPGTAVPMVLILGIFLTKYWVGVELAMQPKLALDENFALAIAALYGVFNGLFAGRALRLLRLAFRPAAYAAA